MYVLMRKFQSSSDQHSVTYSDRPEGFTTSLEVAKAWVKDLSWSGKQYFVEVEEVKEIK